MEEVLIQIESTPNPATMMFKVNKTITETSLDCQNSEEADASPLASKIFGFPWASGVFIGPNFITVTKQEWVDWEVLGEPLAGLIKEHIESDLPIILNLEKNLESENDTDEVKLIKKILDQEIRPQVALDGGDIAFVKYTDNTLFVHMKGACSGCPSSSATLKFGIEARLKESLPNLIEVVAI